MVNEGLDLYLPQTLRKIPSKIFHGRVIIDQIPERAENTLLCLIAEVFVILPLSTREQSKRTAVHPCTPRTGTMPPLLNSSLICRGKLFTWSSLHPLSLLTSQSRSLSAVISGSLRTASLSFTLGSISMSLERISKARGRYIIQAWSSCPRLILTRSQVGHMLQLNSPSPYPNVVLTNLSLLVELREIYKTDTVVY